MAVLSKKDGLDLKSLVGFRQLKIQMRFYPETAILQNLQVPVLPQTSAFALLLLHKYCCNNIFITAE